MTHSMNILYVMSADLNNFKILGQVIKFAQRNRACLTLLDVIGSLPAPSRMLITSVPTSELRNSVVRNRLEQLQDLIIRCGSDCVEMQARVLFGNRAKEIAGETAHDDYDLVIKNPEKGRTDRYLLRNCDCPVWLLKADDFDAAGQILSSRNPQLTTREAVLARDSNSHFDWYSRAQALFR